MRHIHKVIDLRNGMPHAERGQDGRFISRKVAARWAHKLSTVPILTKIDSYWIRQSGRGMRPGPITVRTTLRD